MNDMSNIYEQPVELLRRLVRFDTTNPPGNERDCVLYIRELLEDAGIPTTLLALDPKRPNLLARLEGAGNAPPLLLHGHIDVVTTEGQEWRHSPFGGDLVDGYVWGRGTLDMKGGVAMMVASVLRAKAEGTPLPGDVVLAVLSDEEAGGDYGAGYLVDNHAHLFEGIRYAISESGGSTMHMGGRRFYPVQVAEKGICWLQVTLRGPGGHGSTPIRGGSMAKLGGMLLALDNTRLPVHITPVADRMIGEMSGALLGELAGQVRSLLDPGQTDRVLDEMGSNSRYFDPMLHNTFSSTIVNGGAKINVIPSEIALQLDGRVLPGYTLEDMLVELRGVIGEEAEIEVIRYSPSPGEPNMGLYDTLADILKEADPDGVPVPRIQAGFTDGRHFARLGIQSYGFLPMTLPEGENLLATIHAADERVPAEAIEFGTDAVFKLLQRFGG